MGFVSYYFIPFIVVAFIAYWVTPKKYRYITLLVVSLVFYGWASWKSLFFIVASTVSMYFFARLIDKKNNEQKEYLAAHKGELTLEEKKAYKAKNKKQRKGALVGAILINVVILAVMKYLDFLIGNIYGIVNLIKPGTTTPTLNLFLPLGISFYTFQAIGYIVDVYWGKISSERNFLKFSLFMTFFPKVMQGPIVRYSEMQETLFGEHSLTYEGGTSALVRLLWGYFKKMVIADALAVFVTYAFSNVADLSGIESLLTVFFYFIYDYCDFSGYMDIAIGVSGLFGVKLPENFNHPYFALTIDDYWRRWHTTLGSWFKDYIFYPLSVSKFSLALGRGSKKVFKNFGKKMPAVFGLIVVWLLTGLWHGASWNYVLWGAYYGLIIILSVIFEPLFKKLHEITHIKETSIGWKIFQHIRTIIILAIGRIIFMSPSLSDAWQVFIKMWQVTDFRIDNFLGTAPGWITSAVAVFFSGIVLVVDIIQECKPNTSFIDKMNKLPIWFRWTCYIALIAIVVTFGFYGSGLPHFEFGYVQF